MSVILNLKRKYPGFEIDIPRLDVADEGVTALWGPSGAGKTTIFRLLIGLEDSPGLSWMFGSEDLAALPVPERRIGVVFQTFELFPHLTARENLGFAARARGLNPTEITTRVRELSKALSLDSILERKAAVLSGGEAQRVALGRAVIARPRILFLDEPFAALDQDLRVEARALVKDLIARERLPTLLITHDREDLTALADHVVRLRAGRLVHD